MRAIDFQTEVIDKSHKTPVVVDFWAPWCGPCRTLGPIIEQLAEEADGKWELVKLNTQDQGDVARQYGIMSIPAVKMFVKGEVVGEFVGALPKGQILQWLSDTLPDPRRQDLQGMISRLNGPEHDLALQGLREFVANNPDVVDARIALAQGLAIHEPEAAIALVESQPVMAKHLDAKSDILTLSRLMMWDGEKESLVEKKLAAVQVAFEAMDMDKGMELLIEAVMLDRTYEDDLPRKAAIALFRLWGSDHELTRKYRRRFDMALY